MVPGVIYGCLEVRRATWTIPALLEGHLKKVLFVFLCNCVYLQAALAFLAGSFVAGLGLAFEGLLVAEFNGVVFSNFDKCGFYV
jgi:hypothetical protein